MATFSYNSDDNYVHSMSLNDGGKSSVKLTVGEFAAYLENQNFVCQSSFLESAEIMFVQGQKGQVLDPLVMKALDWKKDKKNQIK
jgi:hypothetical protein